MARRIDLTIEEKYRLLRDISQQIRDTLDLDIILNRLMDMLREVVEYDAGGIFVLSRDLLLAPARQEGGVIAGIARRGYPERPVRSDPMLWAGQGIIGFVIRMGESVVVPDVRRDPRYIMGRHKTMSEIAVPLTLSGRPVGALNLESDRVGAFDEGDLEVLQFVADAASISIEKALLHIQILEKKRIEDQLQIAAEVQSRLLPTDPPRLEGYEVAGVCVPAYEVGGDYYDYVQLGNGRLGVVVADVSGNGIPGALLMTSFRALFVPNARAGKDPAGVMRKVNELLPEFARKRDFITALYGILDTQAHTFAYVNCGHNYPLVVHAGGIIETLAESGPSLNLLPDATYNSRAISLAPGEAVVLYTDGVIELFNSRREEFGIERLHAVVAQSAGRPAREVVERIVEATRAFRGAEPPQDDFTVVVVNRTAG